MRYWDSDCFLGWLKGEPNKAGLCRGVVEGAKKGEIVIVTSALTLAEVIKLSHNKRIPKDHADQVTDFFKNEFIRVQNVDRYVAELARRLVWDHSFLNPKDAIHVATAMRHHLTVFDTFDRDLIKLDGKLGNPPIRIGKPDVEYQADLFAESKEMDGPPPQFIGRKLGLKKTHDPE